METLRPVEISEYYINRIASAMSKYFWENIFKGIFEILKDKTPKEEIKSTRFVPSRRYAYFKLHNKKVYVSINKSVKPEEEHSKELLAISVCRDSKNKEFWLLHKLDKVTVSTQVELDLDELNNDLDSLLNS